MATPGASPNPDLDILRAEMKEFRNRLELLEHRPVTIERIVRTSEATPAWIRAMIVIASAILVPTLAWGAGQLYSLNRSMGVLEQRLAGHEEYTRREFDKVRLEFQQARREMNTGFADVRREMRAGFADLKAELRARPR